MSLAGTTLLNGYLITAVTVCDVHRPTLYHTTPQVISPALAIAERDGASGRVVRRAPQAMVKVTGGGRGMKAIAAQLGLEPNDARGLAYLLPYNDKRRGKIVQLIIGYRGMIDLARRSGMVSSINVFAVFEGDHFDYRLGLNYGRSLRDTRAGGGYILYSKAQEGVTKGILNPGRMYEGL